MSCCGVELYLVGGESEVYLRSRKTYILGIGIVQETYIPTGARSQKFSHPGVSTVAT